MPTTVASSNRGKPLTSIHCVEELFKRASCLTGIVRTAWITLMVSCLYVWVTLAALTDIEFFLPERTLELPIVGSDISVDGFFLFAPAMLLVVFIYFHLMLARLWECYGQILMAYKKEDDAQKLSVNENVEPWFLTVLIPHQNRGFDSIAQLFAILLAWGLGPVTIFALLIRYLRAHEVPLTVFHVFLFAVSIAMVGSSLRHRASALRGEPIDNLSGKVLVRRFLVNFLIAAGITYLVAYLFQGVGTWSSRAMLHRAELSTKPSNWNEYRWQEINQRIEDIKNDLDQLNTGLEASPYSYDQSRGGSAIDDGSRIEALSRELDVLQKEHDSRRDLIIGAELGILPSPEYEKTDEGNGVDCDSIPIVVSSRTLNYAYLVESYLVNANLKCASLIGVDLRYAELQGADLNSADMERINLKNAELRDATLRYARMQDSDLQGARMQNVDLHMAKLNGAKLKGADLRGANLSKADLQNAMLDKVDAQGAIFAYAVLNKTDLNSAKLQRSDLSSASLNDAHLVDARLHHALLYNTKLAGANLEHAQLQGALLWGAEFSSGTSIQNVHFDGAAFKEMDLSETTITSEQLLRSYGDASVMLPENVDYPPHWLKTKIEDSTEFYNEWHRWRVGCGWKEEPPQPSGIVLKDIISPLEFEGGDEVCQMVIGEGRPAH